MNETFNGTAYVSSGIVFNIRVQFCFNIFLLPNKWT